jgi:DNA topoisomerase-1
MMAKNLVIVESPAKAKTISKYLGKDFKVEASIGHIRDLPGNAQEVPEKYKKEKWARLGVDTEHGFKPLYIIPEAKKKQVKKLKDAIKGATTLYLATDEDREGESISWHLLELLNPKMTVKRLVFHEITKEAITKALEHPRDVDMDLVSAQETRRILDRLYGYEVSPVLWKKIAPKLSAGRVQSVAIRLVVERERARLKFRPADYFDLNAVFKTEKKEKFLAELRSIEGKKLVHGKDFDPETGKLIGKDKVHLSLKEAEDLKEAIAKNDFKITSIEQKPYRRNPEAPFTTSTLQQEAARKLRYSAKRTMQVAQKLYENGYITYMRTDSTNLAESAVKEARNLATKLYGAEYLAPAARQFASKVKNAQEAHEAIRPSGSTFRLPETLGGQLTDEELALYELIWKRTIASQMKEAEMMSTVVEVSDGKHNFHASGKQIVFAGFLKAYVQGSDDPDEELEDQEKILPLMNEGESVDLDKMEVKSHQTKPIARFTEASLIKELENRGIGRPSTYAAIMDTIVRRDYVFKQGPALVPTFVAFAVVALMEKYFEHLVDYEFTAEMEEDLDAIAGGKKESEPYLHDFYFGGKKVTGLTKLITQEIDAREACTLKIAAGGDDVVEVRIGRFGPFLEEGEKRAALPDDMPPADLTPAAAKELLEKQAQVQAGIEMGEDPESKLKIMKKVGRYGPYLQLGEKGDKGFKMKSIPKTVELEKLKLKTALEILSWPKSIGKMKDGAEIFFDYGPYGPYLKSGGKNKSLHAEYDPFKLTLKQAEESWNKEPEKGAKGAGARGKGAGAAALKDFGDGMLLKNGRYGMYVTDGKVNASVPKGTDPEKMTKEEAKDLLDKKRG